MPVIQMIESPEKAPEGATNIRDVSKAYQQDKPLWVCDMYVGRCISEREMNGYDDSDFYMLVWFPTPDGGEAHEVMFATTRGWSYPCMGSSVDATPEVLAAYEVFAAKKRAEREAIRAANEAVTPDKGKTVRVVRGRKVAKGTVAEVFWARLESRAFIGTDGHVWPAKGRVGLRLPNGTREFVGADQVEVVNA